MKKIPLDRDKTLMLLRWLKDDAINPDEYKQLEFMHHYSKEELDQQELDFMFYLFPDECKLIKDNGDCIPQLDPQYGYYDYKMVELWKKKNGN